MNKTHYTEDQEDLYQLMGGQMWSLYDDRYNIKQAASECFTKEKLREFAPDKDHFMIHLVGMGDYETFGPNKNADAFRAEGLKKYANTFVTDGCFFREHRNRSQEKEGIGVIKAASYYPDMHRVELIVWGHKKKAEEEYEMAKAGSPLSFSMSCRVPYDECNACGNKARTPREYCDHMKSARLQYIPDFKKYAFVHNDHPTFFDMSRVHKPADRIAHYLEYAFPDNDMRKAASAQSRVILGCEWAEYEGVSLPADSMVLAGAKRAMLEKLANEEQYLEGISVQGHYSARPGEKRAFAENVAPSALQGELEEVELDAFRKVHPGTLFYQLSKQACLLPFFSFAAYATNQTVKSAMEDPTLVLASKHLPSVFRNLLSPSSCCGCSDLGGIEKLFNSSSHKTQCMDQGMDDEVQRFMDKVTQRFSISTEPVRRRVMQITITKSASSKESVAAQLVNDISCADAEKAEAMANLYALYKVAALVDMKDLHGLTIDEAQLILTVSQNRVF
jgi:hypothetical protein